MASLPCCRNSQFSIALTSNHLSDPHLNMQPCGRCHVDERVDGDQVDFSTHQVRDSWLGDSEELGSLCLTHFCVSVVLFRRFQRKPVFYIPA